MTLPVTIETDACCATAREPRVDAAEAERIARVFKALGDPTRVKLLSLIAGGEGGEACICDLTAPVGLSQPTVSHHMRILVDAGLLTREKRGRWAHYSVVPEAFTSLAWLIADPRRGLRTP